MTKQFITKTDLISIRKWTDRLIKKYMPVPDIIKNNPHFKLSLDVYSTPEDTYLSESYFWID